MKSFSVRTQQPPSKHLLMALKELPCYSHLIFFYFWLPLLIANADSHTHYFPYVTVPRLNTQYSFHSSVLLSSVEEDWPKQDEKWVVG